MALSPRRRLDQILHTERGRLGGRRSDYRNCPHGTGSSACLRLAQSGLRRFRLENRQSSLGFTNNKERQTYIQTKLEVVPSPTYYFRKSFELNGDPRELSDLDLNIAFEDGYVVYLNGQEVSRDAIISGFLTESSLAYPNEFTFYRRVDLKAHLNKLVKGTNEIAVEVHRGHPGAPNLFFDLGLSVESNGEER